MRFDDKKVNMIETLCLPKANKASLLHEFKCSRYNKTDTDTSSIESYTCIAEGEAVNDIEIICIEKSKIGDTYKFTQTLDLGSDNPNKSRTWELLIFQKENPIYVELGFPRYMVPINLKPYYGTNEEIDRM